MSIIALDICAFNNKEVAAYNYAFKLYYPALCDFASRLVGTEYAEDLVEDLFLKIWASKQRFNDPDHLKAFLFHSIKNAALDFRKKNERAAARHEVFVDWQEKDEADYLANIIRAEVILSLHEAIATLPAQKGRIVKMTYLDGKTNQEAADELGLSVQTIKNQKLRAIALLKNKLPGGVVSLLFVYPLIK